MSTLFQQRHYEAFARLIRERRAESDDCDADICMQAAIAALFAKDSKKFKAELFARACDPSKEWKGLPTVAPKGWRVVAA